MLTITIKVDAPLGQAIGIKEVLAMAVESFGDTRVVEIKEDEPQQMRIANNPKGQVTNEDESET